LHLRIGKYLNYKNEIPAKTKTVHQPFASTDLSAAYFHHESVPPEPASPPSESSASHHLSSALPVSPVTLTPDANRKQADKNKNVNIKDTKGRLLERHSK